MPGAISVAILHRVSGREPPPVGSRHGNNVQLCQTGAEKDVAPCEECSGCIEVIGLRPAGIVQALQARQAGGRAAHPAPHLRQLEMEALHYRAGHAGR